MSIDTVLARWRREILRVQGVSSVGSSVDPAGRPVILVVAVADEFNPLDLPAELDGIPISLVFHSARPRFLRTRALPRAILTTDRWRPLIGGISIGPNDAGGIPIATGTLGLVALVNGWPHILSCNHVLAQNTLTNLGNQVYQPSFEDGGNANDRVAVVSSFQPYQIENTLVDAALARLDDPGNFLAEILGLGVPSGQFVTPLVGQIVRKSGRTTGLTFGVVLSVDQSVLLFDPVFGDVGFMSQTLVVPLDPAIPFALPGDSGSAVFDDSLNFAGLLFAGDDQGVWINSGDEILAFLSNQPGAGSPGFGIALLMVVGGLGLVAISQEDE